MNQRDHAEPPASTSSTTQPMPAVVTRRLAMVDEYVTEHDLPPIAGQLLFAVVEGGRGAALQRELGVDEEQLRAAEAEFRAAAGESVYDAAIEILRRVSRARR